MAFDIQVFLNDLASPAPLPGKNEQVALLKGAATLCLLHEQMNPQSKNGLLEILRGLTKHKDSFKNCLVQGLLFHVTQKPKYLKQLRASLLSHDGDLTETNASYHSLSGLRFASSGEQGKDIDQFVDRKLFRSLFLKLKKHVKRLYDVVAESNEPFGTTGHVVLITRQILLPPHAPTVDTLKFATRLMRDYGKQVLIVCTAESPTSYDGAVVPAYLANFDARFSGNNQISYDGVSIPFFMCGGGTFGEESVAQAVKLIDTFKPEMILSVGAPSVIGEVFAHRCFTFIYPTSKGVPIAEDSHFHTWDEPTPDMDAIIKRENLQEQFRFAQHPGFDLKSPSTAFSRKQFGIADDAFVFVVVGVRLHMDVSDRFLELLVTISAIPNAHFLLAGNFDGYEGTLARYPDLKSRCSWIGFQKDIMAVYNISDVFLNPERRGGGSGIVYALQAGLPVLSLPVGDAGLAASGFPEITTYDEMADIAQKLTGDAELLKTYQQIAVAEAPKFSGRAALLERIMEEFARYSADNA